MNWLRKLLGGGSGEASGAAVAPDAGFLSALSRSDRVRVSNMNALIYACILKEKRGGCAR